MRAIKKDDKMDGKSDLVAPAGQLSNFTAVRL